MKIFRLTAAAVAILALAACTESDTNDEATNGRVAVQVTNAGISSTITGDTADDRINTRTTDAAWEAGDAIGITLLDTKTGTNAGERTAYRYITPTEAGNFSPDGKDNTAYYPTQGKEVDVLAFYPYREPGADLLIPVSTDNQSDLPAIDLMTADRSTGHSAVRPDVSLAFRHRLVKLVITVDREASAEEIDITGATLTLKGAATRATWNLAEAKLTVETASRADITLTTPSLSDGKLRTESIILPAETTNGITLALTTAAGKVFEAPLPANAALVAGTVNTLRMHLRRSEPAIEASVTDWATGTTANLTGVIFQFSGTEGITFKAEENDRMIFSHKPDAGTPEDATATYTYNEGCWNSNSPLYWDAFDPALPHTFSLFYEPALQPATDDEPDCYAATLTVPFGSELAFTGEHALKHVMARVEATLIPGTGFSGDELKDAIVSLPAVLPVEKINPDGTVIAKADAVKKKMNPVEGTAVYTLVIAPQTFAKGTEFARIDIPGISGAYHLAAPTGGISAEAGKITKVNITLRKTAVGDITVSVTEWTQGNEYTGDAGYED